MGDLSQGRVAEELCGLVAAHFAGSKCPIQWFVPKLLSLAARLPDLCGTLRAGDGALCFSSRGEVLYDDVRPGVREKLAEIRKQLRKICAAKVEVVPTVGQSAEFSYQSWDLFVPEVWFSLSLPEGVEAGFQLTRISP